MFVPVLAVSGREAAKALRRAGFEARTADGVVILARKGRTAVVPEAEILAPEALRAILRDAGMTYTEFVDLLGEPSAPRLRVVRRRISADDG